MKNARCSYFFALLVALFGCEPGSTVDPSDAGGIPSARDAAQDAARADQGAVADRSSANDLGVLADTVASDTTAPDMGALDAAAPDAAAPDAATPDSSAPDTWDPSCPACLSGETCVADRCAPVAVVLAAPDDSFTSWCPAGYQEVGHWRSGPDVDDGAIEGSDFHHYKIDRGWMWLCSARPALVKVVVGTDGCGSARTACDGFERGGWQVGESCAAASFSGVDHAGAAIKQGFLRLCVADGVGVKAEPGHNDCGDDGPGCAGWQLAGEWHTSPSSCDLVDSAVGDSTTGVDTGWMKICAHSQSYVAVDTSTLEGKVVTGYQGWFGAPGDGSLRDRWIHWFRDQSATAASATFDLWPDLREHLADELFPTPMTYPGGAPVELFSSYSPGTVMRHLRWMAQYDIDAAFLQRFLSETEGSGLEFRDQVTRNVMAGAEAYGRAFIVMYDISGADGATLVERLTGDWEHLVDELEVTSSPAYLRHRGAPLVAVWGFGFTDRPGSAGDAQAVVDYFHSDAAPRFRATVMGGVPTHWRTGSGDSQPGFDAVYRSFDVISPWSVGRYSDESGALSFNLEQIRPDMVAAEAAGADYLPVVWPGFSWANLRQDSGLFNQIPRDGGRFFWRQLYEARRSGASMIYVAMFDEVDEATAIFKATSSSSALPEQGQFLALDQDGDALPSDFYLRLAGAAAKVLDGQLANVAERPLP